MFHVEHILVHHNIKHIVPRGTIKNIHILVSTKGENEEITFCSKSELLKMMVIWKSREVYS